MQIILKVQTIHGEASILRDINGQQRAEIRMFSPDCGNANFSLSELQSAQELLALLTSSWERFK